MKQSQMNFEEIRLALLLFCSCIHFLHLSSEPSNGTEIRRMGDVVNKYAYISLTDIAKYEDDTQDDTQDGTQGDTQEKIFTMIKKIPQVSTANMAKKSGIGTATALMYESVYIAAIRFDRKF